MLYKDTEQIKNSAMDKSELLQMRLATIIKYTEHGVLTLFTETMGG